MGSDQQREVVAKKGWSQKWWQRRVGPRSGLIGKEVVAKKGWSQKWWQRRVGPRSGLIRKTSGGKEGLVPEVAKKGWWQRRVGPRSGLIGKDGKGTWWWNKKTEEWFLESEPGSWIQFTDSSSLLSYLFFVSKLEEKREREREREKEREKTVPDFPDFPDFPDLFPR